MSRSRNRLLGLLVGLPVLLVLLAWLYSVGMERLEGKPRGFWQSLEWAAETLSTTGFGADATWNHPAMVLLVVAVQFVGVFLVFLVVPIYLIPFLEERFQRRAPRETPELGGHLVLYRHGSAVETLVEQVNRVGLPLVIAEEDEDAARRLAESGQRVVWGKMAENVLQRAHLDRARALIVNGSDHDNVVAILAARQSGFTGDILALVEEPAHRRPMALSGATHVFTPRHVLGAALAARASDKISPTVAGLESIGPQLRVRELRVERGSALDGRTLGEARVGSQTGAVLVGRWCGGRLESPLGAESRLAAGEVVVAAGSEAGLDRLALLLCPGSSRSHSGPIVVAGCGEVGRTVVDLLRGVGEEVLVVDRVARPGVDRVGDFLDGAVLEACRLDQARSVVLALDSDASTLFVTVLVRDKTPDATIIARVNQVDNIERIHLAGADFALSVSQVSGRILAHRLLGSDAVEIEPRLQVAGVVSSLLDGRTPREAGTRARTGCSIVGVERSGDLTVEVGREFRFAPGDRVYFCGNREAIRRLQTMLPQGS